MPVVGSTMMGYIELLGLLSADESSSDVRLVTMCRLHVIEGEDATLQVGEEVPVPQKTVSSEGTVTTTGYTYVQSGVDLSVKVRSEPSGALRVYVTPEVSTITRYVGETPVKVRHRIESAAVVESGGVFVLGGFNKLRVGGRRSGIPWFQTYKESEKESTRLFVVVRVVEPGKFYDSQLGEGEVTGEPLSSPTAKRSTLKKRGPLALESVTRGTDYE